MNVEVGTRSGGARRAMCVRASVCVSRIACVNFKNVPIFFLVLCAV